MPDSDCRPPRTPMVAPGQIDCRAADMTAIISADLSLGQVQQKLAGHNQWLPIDGSADESIGTLISCDSTGPLRLGYGAWRDLLLGIQFLNGREELITAGGITVKNVAGYDLVKFMVGQRGIFGRIITATTRTYRRPSGAILARHRPDVSILSALMTTSLRPQWALLTSEALLCGYLGDESTLSFYRSTLPRSEPLEIIHRSLEEDIAHRQSMWNVPGDVVFRASVPPVRLNEFTSKLKGRWAADAAFGIVTGPLPSRNEFATIRQGAADLGGTARCFAGAAGPPLELSTTPAERRIIERLKRAFDPEEKLNPLPWRQS